MVRCSRVIAILPVVCVALCALAFAGSETTPEKSLKPTAVHEQVEPFVEAFAETAGLFKPFFVQWSVWGLQTTRGVAGRLPVANEIDRHGRRA